MLIGLVGKPSVGKSTFFKASTLAEVAIASFPFTTIKPNHGIGYVRVECAEKDFNTKCNANHGFCIDGNRFVPIELMDVAGLVPGASEGKGLGNQFLNDLMQADAFIHIVDASGTTDIEGKSLSEKETHDPCEDIRFLEKELNMWYYQILIKAWKSFAKKAEQDLGSKDDNFAGAIAKQFSGLKMTEDHVRDVLLKLNFKEKPSDWNENQLMDFASMLRSKSKPMIIAANKIDSQAAKDNLEKIRKEFSGVSIIPCSADSELALREAAKSGLIDYIPGSNTFEIKKELTENQKNALKKIKEEVLDIFNGTGVQEILNKIVFELLEYTYIFPASANRLKDSKGRTLPDCFLLPKGSTALDFAYFLHTDLGKNFIKAIDAKTKRTLSKNYEIKKGDAIEIITKR